MNGGKCLEINVVWEKEMEKWWTVWDSGKTWIHPMLQVLEIIWAIIAVLSNADHKSGNSEVDIRERSTGHQNTRE